MFKSPLKFFALLKWTLVEIFILGKLFNAQMDHIREKLNKITPSMWQCTLKSVSNRSKDENAGLVDVLTTCHLTLECPSDFVARSLDKRRNENM